MKYDLLSAITCLVLLTVSTAACQSVGFAASTPTVAQSPVASATPALMALASTTPTRKQADVGGVLLGIEIPAGWTAHRAQAGLLLAERSAPIGADFAPSGMELHIFVWPMNRFENVKPSARNPALAALRQVVGDNSLIGNALATEPGSLEWDGHPAAYYLLSDGRDSLGVVLGFALTSSERLVILNLSAPKDQRDLVRGRLHELLAGFTINGEQLNTAALAWLPDPLDFPDGDVTSGTGDT